MVLGFCISLRKGMRSDERCVYSGDRFALFVSVEPRTVSACRICGANLPAGDCEGLCPKCILEQALSREPDRDPNATLHCEPSTPASPFTLRRLRYFGDYELLDEVARGGMGVVFKARQVSLNRTVAVKLISAGALATLDLVKRFKAEAEAAAGLSHPNIVPIYEIGEHQGQHYFSMGLIEGLNLDAYLSGGAAPSATVPSERNERRGFREAEEAARLVLTLARAVQHAHQRGVLHRDIKPGNILIDAEGNPFLTDFGLAKIAQKESKLTHTNAVLGTPSYMAPEQARGDTRYVTTSADVYGLGAVLYTCLTGRPPFAGGTSFETIRQVLEEEPTVPSVFRKGLDRDLETICLKCLAKEPEERYGTAEALGGDLERWRRGEPIHARPISNFERLQKWVKRRPAVAALAAGIALAVIAGTVGVTRQWRRAETNARDLRESLYDADMGKAFQALELGRVRAARDLVETHRLVGERDLRGFEWRYIWGATQPQERFALEAGAGVWGSSVDPKDRFLAAAREDGVIELWDIAERRKVHTFKTQVGIVYGAAFSPDGNWLATTLAAAIPKNPVHIWDMRSLSLTNTLLGHSQMTASVQFSPDSKLLVSGSGWAYDRDAPGELFVWDVATGRKIRELKGHNCAVGWFNSFAPDGIHFAAAHGDGKIRIWNVKTGEVEVLLAGGTLPMLSACFSPDGQSVAGGDRDGVVRYWRTTDPEHAIVLGQHRGAVSYLVFSPDGKQLAASGVDMVARIWNLSTLAEPHLLSGHSDRIWSIHFSDGGKTVVTASSDKTIRFWPNPALETEKPKYLPQDGGGAFSPGGKKVLYKAGEELRMWDRKTRDDIMTVPAYPQTGDTNWQDWAFTPQENEFVTVGKRGSIHFWRTTNGAAIHQRNLAPQTNLHGAPFFSRDGKWLASERGTNELMIWEASTGLPAAVLTCGNAEITGHGFSEDEKRLYLISTIGRLHAWRTGSWIPEQITVLESKQLHGTAFSRDGRWLAFGVLGQQAVRLLDLRSGRSDLLPSDSGWITAVAFSADSATLAAGTLSGEIKLWRISSKREIASIKAHYTMVDWVTFSPDDELLLTSCGPDLRIWHAPPFSETDRGRETAENRY